MKILFSDRVSESQDYTQSQIRPNAYAQFLGIVLRYKRDSKLTVISDETRSNALLLRIDSDSFYYHESVGLLPFDEPIPLLGANMSVAPYKPPKNAEYLFYFFLDGKNCAAIVGDLEERYKLIFKKFGHRRANFWYWKEALSSTGPIMWAWVKKIVMKPGLAVISWMAANKFLPLDSWLVMLVDLVKKIRN